MADIKKVARKKVGMKSISLVALFAWGVGAMETLERRHGHDSDVGEYVVWYNGMAAVVVFLASALGCGFAAAADKIPGIHVQSEVVDIGRHFGTGVIVATAFIHMLVGSMAKLQGHHLPSVISGFSSFGAAVALAAIFAMHLVETVFVSHGEPYSGLHNHHIHLPTMGRKKTTTFILELGILSHSIFVGLSLGLKKSHKFFPLLIAICFHQFFEGIGLGARIAEIEFEKRGTPFLMVIAYSITTSIGIVMGIIVHGTYDPHSTTAVVAEGCLDAISAGILIYTGLVELMGRDLSNDSDFGTKSPKIKAIYLLSLYSGALSMTIIALWA